MEAVEIFLSKNSEEIVRHCKAYLFAKQGSQFQFVCCRYLSVSLTEKYFVETEGGDKAQIVFEASQENESPYIYTASLVEG